VFLRAACRAGHRVPRKCGRLSEDEDGGVEDPEVLHIGPAQPAAAPLQKGDGGRMVCKRRGVGADAGGKFGGAHVGARHPSAASKVGQCDVGGGARPRQPRHTALCILCLPPPSLSLSLLSLARPRPPSLPPSLPLAFSLARSLARSRSRAPLWNPHRALLTRVPASTARLRRCMCPPTKKFGLSLSSLSLSLSSLRRKRLRTPTKTCRKPMRTTERPSRPQTNRPCRKVKVSRHPLRTRWLCTQTCHLLSCLQCTQMRTLQR